MLVCRTGGQLRWASLGELLLAHPNRPRLVSTRRDWVRLLYTAYREVWLAHAFISIIIVHHHPSIHPPMASNGRTSNCRTIPSPESIAFSTAISGTRNHGG